jgi:hypothetical protein
MPHSPYTLSGASSRRPNTLSSTEVNPFYTLLEPHLHEALLHTTNEPAALLSIYTAKRLDPTRVGERPYVVDRLPADIHSLFNDTDRYLLGLIELDLLDFLLNYSTNTVLSIIADSGVGKSTFLHYILTTIRALCPSLNHIFPIIVDCLRLPDATDYNSLAYEVLNEINRLDERSQLPSPLDLEGIRSVMQNARERVGRGEISSPILLIELIMSIKALCAPSVKFVIALDNIDQMLPTQISSIFLLARSLHLQLGCHVLLVSRPSTYTTVLHNIDKHAFLRYSIQLPPVDLRAVLSKRFEFLQERKAGPLSFRAGNSSIQITTVDVIGAMQRLINGVLGEEIQILLLRGLSNNSIRVALALFLRFLQYRHLHTALIVPFLVGMNDQVQIKRVFLEGVMLGSNLAYTSVRNPVLNALCFVSPPDLEPNYKILYDILCLLNYSSSYIPLIQLESWLTAIKHNPDVVNAALNVLLQRRLITSPETESDIRDANYIRISVSGTFYLTELIHETTYITLALDEVPVSTRLMPGQAGLEKICRVASLLNIILELERIQLKAIAEHPQTEIIAPIFGAYRGFGLLSTHMSKTLDNFIEYMTASRLESVRTFATELAPEIEILQKRLGMNESVLAAGFRKSLNEVSSAVPNLPSETKTRQQLVFISYSHQDAAWLHELLRHLRPLERQGMLSIWSDVRIQAGTKWKDEIQTAVRDAKLAIMFISPDFLASEFITENELPPLIQKADRSGTVILPLIVSPCRFLHSEDLAEFQAVNDPARTLEEMTKPERERVYIKVVDRIEACLRDV